jgi:hypothetical protein
MYASALYVASHKPGLYGYIGVLTGVDLQRQEQEWDLEKSLCK